MDLQLSGKVVVVTGAASGIGCACAREFAREGCRVAIWDISPDVIEVARDLTNQFGTRVDGFIVDVRKLSEVELAASKIEEQMGQVEVVVHAAAIGSGSFGFPFTNIPLTAWSRVFEVNVLGMANVAQIFSHRMVPRGLGAMTFIASVAGQIGSQTDPPYSASKAANINFAQCMAKDLAPHGIRVNSVCPGMVQTPLNRSVWQAWYDQQPAEMRRPYDDWANEKVRNVIPLGRWQRSEDVAYLVTFLSSQRASEITGQTINVDGGFVMHS